MSHAVVLQSTLPYLDRATDSDSLDSLSALESIGQTLNQVSVILLLLIQDSLVTRRVNTVNRKGLLPRDL